MESGSDSPAPVGCPVCIPVSVGSIESVKELVPSRPKVQCPPSSLVGEVEVADLRVPTVSEEGEVGEGPRCQWWGTGGVGWRRGVPGTVGGATGDSAWDLETRCRREVSTRKVEGILFTLGKVLKERETSGGFDLWVTVGSVMSTPGPRPVPGRGEDGRGERPASETRSGPLGGSRRWSRTWIHVGVGVVSY